MKTKNQNPNGLHQKYFIQKLVFEEGKLNWSDRSGGDRTSGRYVKKPVDKDAEYFVLRLDEKQKSKEHLVACRIAINHYAAAIEHTIPQLAKDLRERYPLITTNQTTTP